MSSLEEFEQVILCGRCGADQWRLLATGECRCVGCAQINNSLVLAYRPESVQKVN
jgi:hypothetical protein